MSQSKAKISKIESFSTVDGPGIRTTIFFSKCNLRCKYCHNPETWYQSENEYTIDDLYNKIMRNKPYFKNNRGVKFSGGEHLLHSEYLNDICKKIKKEKIHIALDTAGIGKGNYKEILEYVDLILLDIKHITREEYIDITQTDNFNKFEEFIKELNKSNKDIWIRQVIIPEVNDNKNYINSLVKYLKENFNNIKKIEFLPFHTLGFSKYERLKLNNPYKNKQAMDEEKCNKLYDYFIEKYKKEQ